MKLAIILAGPVGLLVLFLVALLASSCTLKEDCTECTVQVDIPDFPKCLEYDIDAGTIKVCPIDAGPDGAVE